MEIIFVVLSTIGVMAFVFIVTDHMWSRLQGHPSLLDMVLAFSQLTEEEMEKERQRIKDRAKQLKNRKGR